MHIYLGADHRGLDLKNSIIDWLNSRQISFTDFGANAYDAEDDFNDYAKKVTTALLDNYAPGEDFGVLICGSAQGMAIQANRFKGVRAAICHNPSEAIETRGHNDANILCLAADSDQATYAATLDAFLNYKALSDEKYARRVQKLDED